MRRLTFWISIFAAIIGPPQIPLALAQIEPDLADSSSPPIVNPSLLHQIIETGTAMKINYVLNARSRVLGVIPVRGSVFFYAEIGPENYQISSVFALSGIAGMFVDYRLEQVASGYTTQLGLEPYNYVSQVFDKKRNESIDITYLDDTVKVERIPRFTETTRNAPELDLGEKLTSMDPLTSLLHYMLTNTAPEEDGFAICGPDLNIFDGAFLTLLSPVTLKTNAPTGDILTDKHDCSIRMHISGSDDTIDLLEPLKLEIQYRDGLRVLTRVKAKTKAVGRILLQMKRLEITPL